MHLLPLFSLLFGIGLSWDIYGAALKPTDYQPVVSAPWEPKGSAPDVIIRRIYLEPMRDLRMGLLAEYLRMMPVMAFDSIFDLAVSLEGYEAPDPAAFLILEIWAQRAPTNAWIKTKQLFNLVGIEEGVLSYAGWDHGRIRVVNHEAIQKAGYRLSRGTLIAFPTGIDASELTGAEKVKLWKQFNEVWYAHFDEWPGKTSADSSWLRASFSRLFEASGENLRFADSWIGTSADAAPAYELIVRRRLVEDVRDARALLEEMSKKQFEGDPGSRIPPKTAGPSAAFLLLWARADKDDLMKWSDEVADTQPDNAWLAKCILMSFVDDKTSERWARSIVGTSEFEERLHILSAWEPERAMQLALKSTDYRLVGEVLNSAGYGSWNQMCFDTCHYGFAFAQDFNVSRIPIGHYGDALSEGCTGLMEQWDDTDSGQSARFGMKIVLLIGDVTRANLLKTLRGEIMSADDDGVWDRTFCALRIWAIMKPNEMREWISKQPDQDLRESLTWLLEHPWGEDPELAENQSIGDR